MPIITFLQDVFSVVKGPYHRKIGKHTQRFCSRAAKRSANEIQRKVFFVTAICADELIAALLGVDNKRQVEVFSDRILQPNIAKQQVTVALRVYMSGLLTLISFQKGILLQKTGLEEQQLLNTWCSIFEYSPSDMQLFNEEFLPAYQRDGIQSLCALVGKHIIEQLYTAKDALRARELEFLQDIMLKDAVAVVRMLPSDTEEAV